MKPRPTREVKKLLRDVGFVKKRQSGSHATWKHRLTGHSITLIEKGGGRDMSPAMVAEALRVIDAMESEMNRRSNAVCNDEWVDVNEAAKMIGVSHTTARALRDKGDLTGKKMRLGNQREKWFIETRSIVAYQNRGAIPARRIDLLERKLAAAQVQVATLEGEREGLKTIISDLKEQAATTGLEGDEDSPSGVPLMTNPGLLELQAKLNSPEVRFLLGQGPTLEEVCESVVTRGLTSINAELDDSA